MAVNTSDIAGIMYRQHYVAAASSKAQDAATIDSALIKEYPGSAEWKSDLTTEDASLAWYTIMQDQRQQALTLSNQALAPGPGQIWLETNHAEL